MENIKEKMTKNKRILIIAIIAIILIVLAFASVRYVTTSTNLQGDKLASSSNAVGVTSVEIDTNGTTDATYTINDGGASVSFTATLGSPGDSVNYIINVQNNNYEPAAIVDSVEITSTNNPALKYTTDAKGKIINKGTTGKIEFRISYIDTEESIPDSTEITVKFKFAKYGVVYGNTKVIPLSLGAQTAKFAGLYPDSTESGRYYYSGSSTATNNNIVFNGEPYRILGFEPDGRIKIMKMVSIGTQYWNKSSTSNIWSTSSLRSYLEETWLPTQESGEDYQHLTNTNEWYVGIVTQTSNISTVYTTEKNTIVNSAVGLVSVSEFLKAKYTGSTFLNYTSAAWWTISGYGNTSRLVWSVRNGGLNSGNGYQDTSSDVNKNLYAVFPVLYLKSSVSLTGSGTATDPYCVVSSACPTDLDFTQRAS